MNRSIKGIPHSYIEWDIEWVSWVISGFTVVLLVFPRVTL